MQQLVGKTISHITFGKGVVTKLTNSVITADFPEGEKKFLFPDAFGKFLLLKDGDAQAQVNGILRDIAVEERHKKEIETKRKERLQRISGLKITPNSQAAFALMENTEEQVFSTWSVSTGCYLSGCNKGEPRIPTRLKPNSACLITVCPNKTPEKERRIIGAFMVRDDFNSAACTDGIIHGHETHRIMLEESEALPFWKYFDEDSQPPKWGKSEMKYFSNATMQQILIEMQDQITDAARRRAAEDFYLYFCRINRLAELQEAGA